MTRNNGPAPYIVEALNARTLSLPQVAASFVPPPFFDKLIRHQHTLLLGQRGSGKTTLQKMLTPQALDQWKHAEADAIKDSIGFIGVFIPTDTSWWVDAPRDAVASVASDEAISPLVMAAFTTHVFRMLVESFEYLVRTPTSFARASAEPSTIAAVVEASLVADISASWNLSPRLPSFMSLKYSLDIRQSEIETLAFEVSLQLRRGLRPDTTNYPRYLALNYITCVSSAIRIFRDQVALSRDHWALCFDELELAPPQVVEKLFARLRSTDQSLLFKLSLSPYGEATVDSEATTDAQPKHDFEVIPLWYARKEDGYQFSRSLVMQFAGERQDLPRDADDIFGDSPFDSHRDAENPSPYEPGSKQQATFLSLAQKDPSFAKHLALNDIDPNALGTLTGHTRASDVRKIVAIVTVRDAFLAAPRNAVGPSGMSAIPQRQRSRKNPTIYHGATAVYAACEGNPRWLKAVAGELLRDTTSNLPLDAAVQARVITSMANIFRSLLRTVPVPHRPGLNNRGLLDLLDDIGDYFFRVVVLGPFKSDPALTFTIDANIPPATLDIIGRALNAGAIVYVPDSDDDVQLMGCRNATSASLRGKRFRLGYLLAAYHHLPLMLGKKISLRQILRGSRSEALTHATLFDEEDGE